MFAKNYFPKLFCFAISCTSFFHAVELIKDGYKDPNSDWSKFIVSVRVGDDNGHFGVNHICGGTVIFPKVILTAAHCVLNTEYMKNPEVLHVVAGSQQRLEKTNDTRFYSVQRIVIYPGYDLRLHRGDLALLHLNESIEIDGNKVDGIQIRKNQPRPDEVCTVFGWGEILNNGPIANELIFLNLTLLQPFQCASNYFYTKGVICAGNNDGSPKDTGVGDSGGPLICGGVLTGIMSYGFPRTLQSFYADVWYYRTWILKNSSNKMNSWTFSRIFILSFTALEINMFNFFRNKY